MLFTSSAFLFGFLPLVLAGVYLAPKPRRNALLAASSYVFYGWWKPWFLLLILFSTTLDYQCGRVLHRATRNELRRAALLVSLSGNLGLLAFFKYAMFGTATVNDVLRALGRSELGVPQIVLPVGISFFTFQSMSYTIDLFRRRTRPARSLLDFVTYVALFPQLVAGPIVRYRDLEAELRSRHMDAEHLMRGLSIFSVGLAKKVLLANNLAPVADAAFAAEALPPVWAWLGVTAYALQIYFDFSGYSDMAIGLGVCLGFTFPQNFDAPYRAESITDFWRRWHISLSTWLRDYLYIPLGGNRGGTTRTYRNLALTMLLGGLWHGANWTFVAWGGLHGLLLCGERALGRRPVYAGLPKALRVASTFGLILVTWVFFRAETLGDALRYLAQMVGLGAPASALGGATLVEPFTIAVLVVSLALSLTPWRTEDWLSPTLRGATVGKMTLALALFVWSVAEVSVQSYNPFLYFQF